MGKFSKHEINPDPDGCRIMFKGRNTCPFIDRSGTRRLFIGDTIVDNIVYSCKVFPGDLKESRRLCKEECDRQEKEVLIKWVKI